MPSDPRLAFNQVADIYDDVRPSYPADLFDTLFDILPEQPTIVEVGPGTGQATADLLNRSASVYAVEISPAMAAKLRTNHRTPRLQVSIGDFEVINIKPASVHAVFSATAYHWISRNAQTDRPARILQPGGVVAIVDLIQVDSPDDLGFFAAARPIYEHYGQSHVGPTPPIRDAADPAIRARLQADGRFNSVDVQRYDWNQTYTATDYRKLMLSYSTTQLMTQTDQIGLLDDIERFIRSEFDGAVTRPLVVTLTTALLA